MTYNLIYTGLHIYFTVIVHSYKFYSCDQVELTALPAKGLLQYTFCKVFMII